MLGEENDMEIYRIILSIEPSIASSKYIFKLSKMLTNAE